VIFGIAFISLYLDPARWALFFTGAHVFAELFAFVVVVDAAAFFAAESIAALNRLLTAWPLTLTHFPIS
jgi:hypothetical protein